MKGQSQVIAFVLLFAIGTVLVVSAVLWSDQMFRTNKDFIDLDSAEKMMFEIDSKIISVSKYGGKDSVDINIDGFVELKDDCYKNYRCLEYYKESSVEIPNYWLYLKNDTSVIRERRVGSRIEIQLYYPYNETNYGYGIEPFSDGNYIGGIGSRIEIEKNKTFYVDDTPVKKIKLTFTYR